jgi:hypothetical protein
MKTILLLFLTIAISGIKITDDDENDFYGQGNKEETESVA